VIQSQDGGERLGSRIPEAGMEDMAGTIDDQSLDADVKTPEVFSGGGKESLTRNVSNKLQTITRQYGSLSITYYVPVHPTP
jgi:hypothetical protein